MKEINAIIAGAAPDTGNLGVNALSYAAAANLLSESEAFDITILDHSKDFKPYALPLNNGKACHLLGAKTSKRFYEPSSFANISFSKHLPFVNTLQKKIFSSAKAILDISGGDSFTDLYGPMRFNSIIYPKRLAMEYNVPLILLPQTYGPFNSEESKQKAASYVKYATFAFARDVYSFEVMKELLGDSFDDEKHFQAVDVAFLLPKSDDDVLRSKGLLPDTSRNTEVFGLNISGLIYQNPQAAKEHYNISVDYNRLVEEVALTLLQESEGEVWLIPHVLAPQGHYESDNTACIELRNRLPQELQSRVKVIEGDYDQCDIKGVISHCSWFCGTRMHATIASLSQAIPTLGLAYSGKFQGVFESAGMGDYVVDARESDFDNMKQRILSCWRDRAAISDTLSANIVDVKAKATDQMHKIVQFISK